MGFLRRTILPGSPPPSGDGWSLLRIGGGGWTTRVEFANDGTAILRNDTHGFHVLPPGGSEWIQQFTTDAFTLGTDSGNATSNGNLIHGPVGTYEACIAPSDSDVRMSMQWHHPDAGYYIYRSDDGGATYSRTAKSKITTSGNDAYSIYNYRFNGPYAAIHPTDPDTAVFSTISGVPVYTEDGGATWTACNGVLAPTTLGPGAFVRFNPNDGNDVVIGSDGRGMYRSTTGVSGTFTLTSSGPTTFQFLDYDEHGRVWACARSGTHTTWRFASGSWSNITVGGYSNQIKMIISDPRDINDLYAQLPGGDLLLSTNNASSFADPNFNSTRVAPSGEPEWLEVTNESYMSAGVSAWDPLNNRLMFPCGIGPFHTDTPDGSIPWQSLVKGIEQMVCTKIISPPGSGRVPLASFWDRSVFRIDDPEVYPTGHGLNYTQAIAHGFDVAYAIANPDTIICYTANGTNQFGVSSNGGATWSLVTNPTGLFGGGSVAAATATNFVQVSADHPDSSTYARLRYSTNGGSSWSNSTQTGVPTSSETGWGISTIEDRHILTCDAAGHYYAYNNGSSGSDSFAGIYKSTDGGATFARSFNGRMLVHPSEGSSGPNTYAFNAHNAQLEAVPDNAGCLFYTPGNVDGFTTSKFLRCIDAGVTWVDVPNVTEVKKFGFGKASSGSIPVLYIVGSVSGTYGVYMCENPLEATISNMTWTNIGTYPVGRSDVVTAVCGDMNLYKRVMIGYRGSSIVYRDIP